MKNCKANISAYLASHHYLRLGTVTAQNTPQVHTLGYVSEGCTVYFVTDRKSRKALNIFNNPAVAYAVDENYENVMDIQGVQMEGRASLVALETDAIRLMGLMTLKFPGLENMPPNPDLAVFKIDPARGYFIDNTASFGHRELMVFS
jgi:nitroimidazol reductase NimA-like FMN-containing flavoprotein (pyridoxamine 5'-phosphate oxidase superfamily)